MKADLTRGDELPRSQMTVSFPRIEPVTLRDKIVALLKEAFFSGKLRPGDPIVERELARQFDSGTPAVREALITLEQQGFVHRIANKATYVTEFNRDEVEQLYLLRTELELIALRWAKPRVTENDLEALEKMTEDIIEAAKKKEAHLFYERDLAFHRQCWALAGNNFLYRCLETIVAPLFAFVLGDSQITVNEAVAREHLNIVNALRNLRDPDFSSVIRSTLSGFALKGMTSIVEVSKSGSRGAGTMGRRGTE
ncbi:MAG: GntR family transcriptional regulator [Acidobacteriia bacterium]|nr:GntR family transcriptional regulator [Terriglobia bacterium]